MKPPRKKITDPSAFCHLFLNFEMIMHNQIENYMNKYLSDYLCGFRKGYSTQYCLIFMLEKWKKELDKRMIAAALLTDLSKAFGCLNHELLIAKLEAYGFDHASLLIILNYLSGRKHRTKVNNYCSGWSSITSGVPEGSILGPLIFNIYINDIFYFVDDEHLANYADDDNTPHTTAKNIDTVLNYLANETYILIKWFDDNYFKLNGDKCKLLVPNNDENTSLVIDGHRVTSQRNVKLLGIKIDNKLDFNDHVSMINKKASHKLHALARIFPFMNKNKLRVLMKAFIESQFGYCPLIWMFHSRKLNNKINRLHERALRLVYKNSTLSFNELTMDNSFTVHQRNLQQLATEMYKIINDLTPRFMKSTFPLSNNHYTLRKASTFQTDNITTVRYGSETLAFRGHLIWESVPIHIQNSQTVAVFKQKIKQWTPSECQCRICKNYIFQLGFVNSVPSTS